ncbi:MAG: cysteine hydrolase [Deltaproteobacteria bacterium]|nr:cysteine hydrolase [Deltaproteobacteria bacterium]
MLRSFLLVLTLGCVPIFAGCTPPFSSGPTIESGMSERAAFIVLDVQRDFMRADGAFPVDEMQSEAVLLSINETLVALPEDAEVVYARNAFDENDVANPFRGNSAIAGSEGALFDERLVMIDAPVFLKKESDAFSSSTFDAFLRKEKITQVYLSGVYADGCVFATALAAQQRGYDVTIVEDAVATETDERLENAFAAHRDHGFEILHSDVVLERFVE